MDACPPWHLHHHLALLRLPRSYCIQKICFSYENCSRCLVSVVCGLQFTELFDTDNWYKTFKAQGESVGHCRVSPVRRQLCSAHCTFFANTGRLW